MAPADATRAHAATAALFAAMAAPCLTHPDLVARLFLTGGPLGARERLLLRCFASQALLTAVAPGAGADGGTRAHPYRAWALAIVPFSAFDAAAYAGGLLTAAGAVGDALGNAAFVALAEAAARAL